MTQSALTEALRNAQRVVVFTGAGVSAESGIRTFRDEMDGLWSEYSVDDVVSIDGFLRNPGLVWRWHEWFRGVALKAKPNNAHLAIAAAAQSVPELTVITQNIDGLHQRAGSANVIELHGNIHHVRCVEERRQVLDWPQGDRHPTCTDCGSLLRHDIVWFGEMLPDKALTTAMRMAAEADVLIVVGTSSVVYPAAQIPLIALQSGAFVAVVNPEETPLVEKSHAFLKGAAGEILPELFKQAWPETFPMSSVDEEKVTSSV